MTVISNATRHDIDHAIIHEGSGHCPLLDRPLNRTELLVLAQSESKVIAIIAHMRSSIVAINSITRELRARKEERLAGHRVAVDIRNGVVERRDGVGEAPDEFRGVGRVVLVVLGDAEAVALAGDGLRVQAAAAGDGLGGGLLIGAGDGQEDLLLAVVADVGGTGHCGRGEGQEAGQGDEGGVHDVLLVGELKYRGIRR